METLRAANGTDIQTHGHLPLTLILGLNRTFLYAFTVTDVLYFAIGIDVLRKFDAQNRKTAVLQTLLTRLARALSSTISHFSTLNRQLNSHTTIYFAIIRAYCGTPVYFPYCLLM